MQRRNEFTKTLQEPTVWNRSVRRSNLYEDVLKLYSDETIVTEYPLRIKFEQEMAIDLGGVSRDMVAGFWEHAYKNLFDGSSLLTPVMHPQTDMNIYQY